MLAATHAIAGAAIASISPDINSSIFFSLISHPILDYIPHWDLNTRHTKRKKINIIIYSLTDASVGFLVGIFLFSQSVPKSVLLLSMFAAQLPDWLEAPYTILGWKFPPFSWIKSFQHRVHSKLPFPDGLWTQFILIFFLLLVASGNR